MKIYWIIIFTFICSIGVQSQSLIWSKKSNPYFNSINSIAFNGDGTKVISGTDCHPAAIRMFDVNTGTLLWDYEVGSNFMCIMGIGFSSNNHYIASIEELNDPEEVLQILTLVIFQGLADPLWARENS